MPIKVVGVKLNSEDHAVTRAQIINMVTMYRANPSGGVIDGTQTRKELTHFSHFPLKQILELCMANRIVNENDTIGNVIATKKNFGIKIYLSQHVDINDCPVGGADYIGRNTVVLVNTQVVDQLWNDMLNDNPVSANFVETSGFDIQVLPPGNGSDKTDLCPPQCHLFRNSL